MSNRKTDWPDDTPVTECVRRISQRALNAYKANSTLVEEHANLERAMAQGSYGHRQIYELVQNGADAMLEEPGGRIHVLLTEDHLYCANEGAPVDEKGVEALLHSNLSVKRTNEIGRFGLGFKSVLGVTDKPEFFCRAGSFGFDAEKSAARIREVVPSADRCPTLRLAHILNARQAGDEDSELAEMMEWATTVVRLPRSWGKSQWLPTDVAEFPAEFLLFCPHVGSVVLEDKTSDVRRELTLEQVDDQLRIGDGKESSLWKVFQAVHTPSPAAKEDAGELADREELPVAWAVPTEGRITTGRFWAFFPLRHGTTLSGIANAPWKISDDRAGLLEGPFNEELLDVVADLVVDNLGAVSTPDDPGRHLDIMPGRGREARCQADSHLTWKIYHLAADRPSLPDQEGVLRCPEDVSLHPEGIPQEVLEIWSSQPDRPAAWCHPSVETRERRPRAERLHELAKQKTSLLGDWLLALSASDSPAHLAPAIRVAAALFEANEDYKLKIRLSWIVADGDGNRAQPIPEKIFLPGDHNAVSARLKLVHRDLANKDDVRRALGVLEIVPATPERELKATVSDGFAGWKDENWVRFWELVRIAQTEEAIEILRSPYHVRSEVSVRALDGVFHQLPLVLLPGPVVPTDGSRDASVAVDTEFHEQELAVIAGIGVVAEPTQGIGVKAARVFEDYRRDVFMRYQEGFESGSRRPQWEKLDFNRDGYAGPLEPLARLSDEGGAAFTKALLAAGGIFDSWTVFHRTQDHYPRREFESPGLWIVAKYGTLDSSLGPQSLRDCIGPNLQEWSAFFPVASCPSTAADSLGLIDELSGVSVEQWSAALTRIFHTF